MMLKIDFKYVVFAIGLMFVWPLMSHAKPIQSKSENTAALGFSKQAKAMVRTHQAHGVSIVVVKSNQTSYYNAGQPSHNSQYRVTSDTVFEIGSISKVFSSLIMAHAIEEGRFSLADPITKHLPDGFGGLNFDGKFVQIEHLNNTTSALPDHPKAIDALLADSSIDNLAAKIADTEKNYSFAVLLDDLKTSSLQGAPGEVSRHSNLAASLNGALLNRHYQRPYNDLLKHYIEKPYGMNSGVSLKGRKFAHGYLGDGKTVAPFLWGEAIMASGGLKYSAVDMGRFLKAQLQSHETAIKRSHTILYGDVSTTAIAYHWFVTKTPEGYVRYHASGGTLGFSSYIEFYPELNYGVVLMANRPGNVQNLLGEMAEQGRQKIFARSKPH